MKVMQGGELKEGAVQLIIRVAAALCAAGVALVVPNLAMAGPPAHLAREALDVPSLNHACGAASDSKGDLYASSVGEGKIKVFAPDDHSTPIATISNVNGPCALAVSAEGDLLVSEQSSGNVVM